MAARVFVFGSINTDLVVYVSHLPQPGETIGGGTYRSFPGGKGANQAVAAARAGAVVQLYGCLGDDAFGRERLASLEQTGVSTRGVRVLPDVASGVAEITVDAAGENTIVVAPGANDRFAPEGVEIPSPSPGRHLRVAFPERGPAGIHRGTHPQGAGSGSQGVLEPCAHPEQETDSRGAAGGGVPHLQPK